jgi:hypothetical protein
MLKILNRSISLINQNKMKKFIGELMKIFHPEIALHLKLSVEIMIINLRGGKT